MKDRLKKVIVRNLIFLTIFISYYLFFTYTNIGIPCIFKLITGYDCPGCGITRCLFSLVKLNIKEAFYYNELVTIFIVPFIIIYIYYDYCYVYDKKNKLKNYINKISIYLLLPIVKLNIINLVLIQSDLNKFER